MESPPLQLIAGVLGQIETPVEVMMGILLLWRLGYFSGQSWFWFLLVLVVALKEILPKCCGLGVGMALVTLTVRSHSAA